jgi:hypothetical protein
MPDLLENGPPPDTTGTINIPDVSAKGKIKRRAISSPRQARNIITTFEGASRERNVKNARIMAKYNSEKPFTQASLDNDGLGWKSNFTTKPLPMLVNKVAPRFVKAEQSIKYLVNSALPDTTPGAAEKTEAYRREITKTCRAWEGWTDLIAEISQENALFGYTSVAWLDEFHWKPKHFRQDEFFVPTGTKHLSSTAQVITLREVFLINELFELIEDNEAASAAGWNVQNTVMAINSAMPLNRRSQAGFGEWGRIQEDLIRESSVGLSLESGPLTVTVWHVLAQEVTGKVSHYILTENANAPADAFDTTSDHKSEVLFEREDQFDNMAMAASFFSFEQANGKLHGSKGIGREIYSMAAMLDRARNEVVDRLNLAGKLIIQCGEKQVKKFKASIVGPALLIGQEYNIAERKIDGAVEPFLELDQFLTGLLDQMAGATTPKFFEGERVTKAQVDLYASREEESKDNIIGRFLTQLARMMKTVAKRQCDPHTADEDAKEMQKRLLEIMTREELNLLSDQPVAQTIADYTGEQRQRIVLIAQEARGNPLYNQREMERRKLASQIDEQFADAVLLPDEDPTELAEQTRLQQMELLILAGQGSQVPISPRDNHLIHLQTLLPAMESTAQTAADPDAETAQHGIEIMHAMLDHANQHLQAAIATGTPKEALAEITPLLTKMNSALEQATEQLKQQQQLANEPEQLPPSPEALAAAGQQPQPTQPPPTPAQ